MGLFSAGRLRMFSLLAAVAGCVVQAQTPRLESDFLRGESTEISGNVSPRAQLSKDQGLVSAEKRLANLSLRFSRTSQQQRELDQLLVDQQNPASPRYHRWLTPEQFRGRFGLADADLGKISAWLNAQGFTAVESGSQRHLHPIPGDSGAGAACLRSRDSLGLVARGAALRQRQADPSSFATRRFYRFDHRA